jgi:hypothetical protein
VVAVESALGEAIVGLTAAQSVPDLLRAACVAADAGEAAATTLARDGVADAPGYLAAADAFATVRVELEKWVDAPPLFVPAVARAESAELHRQLADLATLLHDRLNAVRVEADAVDLAAAIDDARLAAADACRALRGPVCDVADFR